MSPALTPGASGPHRCRWRLRDVARGDPPPGVPGRGSVRSRACEVQPACTALPPASLDERRASPNRRPSRADRAGPEPSPASRPAPASTASSTRPMPRRCTGPPAGDRPRHCVPTLATARLHRRLARPVLAGSLASSCSADLPRAAATARRRPAPAPSDGRLAAATRGPRSWPASTRPRRGGAPATGVSTSPGAPAQPVRAALPAVTLRRAASPGAAWWWSTTAATRTTYEPVAAAVARRRPVAAGAVVGRLAAVRVALLPALRACTGGSSRAASTTSTR